MFYWCWQFSCDSGPASLAVSSSVCSHTNLLDCRTAPETNPGGFSGSLFSGSLAAASSRLATVGFVITGSATEVAFGKNLLPGRRSLSGLRERIDLRGGLGEGSFSRGMLCAGGCAKEWVVDVGSSLGGAVLEETGSVGVEDVVNNVTLKSRLEDVTLVRGSSMSCMHW